MAAAANDPGERGGSRAAGWVLAPRLVRLAHHDYSDGLLAGESERRAPGQGGWGVRPPPVLGLRQAVGDHQQHARMVPHAAVAAPHLDVLGERALVLEAAPPRDHTVAT